MLGDCALMNSPPNANDVIKLQRLPAGVGIAQFKKDKMELIISFVMGEDDLRVLPVRYSAEGKRERAFSDAVARCTTTTFADFPVRGPRTAAWCFKHILSNGLTPTGRHSKFKADGNMTEAMEGVEMHRILMLIVELFLTYDQLNLSELAGGEELMRVLQLLEEGKKDRFIRVGGKDGSSGGIFSEESHLYLGIGERHNLMICPALTDRLAKKMTAQALIDKARRKAREERRLAKAPPPKKEDEKK